LDSETTRRLRKSSEPSEPSETAELTTSNYKAAEVIPDDFPDLEKRFGDNPESKASDPSFLELGM
jgi:hypothetical protein